jgi:peptidoglycan/LPS O-acetylase OafA/YrhL
MNWLSAYPLPMLSSLAMYALLTAALIPKSREFVRPLFTHPVPPTQDMLGGFDSLRGIAAAMVALGHCWWATYPVFASTQLAAPWIGYGTKWVSVFAVLSGFLIYRSGLNAIKSPEALRSYGIRRLFRVYPVYALGVLLCLWLGQYSGNATASPVAYFFSDLFMLPVFNWPNGFANPPTWSLFVEVAFYIVLPILIAVVARERIVLFCVIAIAVMLLADNQSRIFALWKYFLIGMIASELSPMISKRSAILICVMGIILLVLDFHGPRFDWAEKLGIGVRHADEQTLGLGIGCGLLLAGLPQVKWLSNALSIFPLRMLGVISYSLYITHFFYIYASAPEIGPFTHLGSPDLYKHFSQLPQLPGWYLPLVFFPGSIFWAAVCFILVERPGMQFGRYLSKKCPPVFEAADCQNKCGNAVPAKRHTEANSAKASRKRTAPSKISLDLATTDD